VSDGRSSNSCRWEPEVMGLLALMLFIDARRWGTLQGLHSETLGDCGRGIEMVASKIEMVANKIEMVDRKIEMVGAEYEMLASSLNVRACRRGVRVRRCQRDRPFY